MFRKQKTIPAANMWPDEILRRRLGTSPSPPKGLMALYFAGRGDPMVIEMRESITLGRYIPGEPSPTIDLGAHHAGAMGVSRLHACIHSTEDGYFLEDLDSTNGTRLNDEKLQPKTRHQLNKGDQIRLGELIFYVIFR